MLQRLQIPFIVVPFAIWVFSVVNVFYCTFMQNTLTDMTEVSSHVTYIDDIANHTAPPVPEKFLSKLHCRIVLEKFSALTVPANRNQ